ncbi:MAG: Flp pilus assembly protein CpaB [Oscillospiraceae bacterium]
MKILALVSAVATALLLFIFLNSLNKPTDTIKTKVITAAADIPADTPITAEMLTVTELPAEAVLRGTLTDASQIQGKISESKIYAGEQITSSMLISAGEKGNGTLAYAIEPGMRAITIAVDETAGLSYMITPGNHVDIIGEFLTGGDTGESSSAENEKISYTVMILEDITVLAVDSVLSEDGKIKSEAPAYTAITLQVTPEQAMELSMAQFEGQLRTVLRSPVDNEKTNQSSFTLKDVLQK